MKGELRRTPAAHLQPQKDFAPSPCETGTFWPFRKLISIDFVNQEHLNRSDVGKEGNKEPRKQQQEKQRNSNKSLLH